MNSRYKVVITKSGIQDIKEMKTYILEHFKYRSLAENFSSKMKKLLKSLDTFPESHQPTGFYYRGYKIYFKPRNTYLTFYTVSDTDMTVTVLRIMKDGMNWKYIIQQWLQEN
jgi:Plasmid stabilisation system protein.